MKILFISDIHGITTNLNVIEKIMTEGNIDKLVCLGDLYYPGPSYDNKYEIDYILQNKNEIIPIEVKANEVTHNTSLNVYNTNYEPKTRIRFSMKNLQKDGNLINIPLFMIEYVDKFK